MVRRIVENSSFFSTSFTISRIWLGEGGATRKVSGEVFGILLLSRKVKTYIR